MEGGEENVLALPVYPEVFAINSSSSSDSESSDDDSQDDTTTSSSSSREESSDSENQEDGSEVIVDLGEVIHQNLHGDEQLHGLEGGNNEALEEVGENVGDQFNDILGVDHVHVEVAYNPWDMAPDNAEWNVLFPGGNDAGEGEDSGEDEASGGETTSDEEGGGDATSSAGSSNKPN